MGEEPRSQASVRSKVRLLPYYVKVKLKVSSLPVPLLNTPPAEQRFIHRLTYGTLPAIGRETGTPQTPTALKFEVTLGLSDTKSVSEGDTADHPQHKSSVNKTIDLAPMCSVGPEAHLNLMIPDRFV